MRVAAAPISWGVCEVPGWGRVLDAATVLGEMSALGVQATELGPPGYLPRDPAELRELLGTYDLTLVGGFLA
ncbi:MAG TPA: inosose dehydratase, partial [Streptomyces sp.]